MKQRRREPRRHPTFLKALGPLAKAELLSIFNESFSEGVVPGISKEATVLPLKKAGKLPGAISYRPVSLTSCVVKTMEGMVHNRLYNLAGIRGWLCSEQAGFQPHDPPHKTTARSIYHLIIRRRETGHAHGIRVALAISRSRGHLY